MDNRCTGYNANTADFALLAFTTCLEGLFSTGEQELTFRLALRVAQFLGNTEKQRRKYYSLMRLVYRNRSKLVHEPLSQKIVSKPRYNLWRALFPRRKDWLGSLRKVFQLRLESLFSNGNRVDEVFDTALFAPSFQKALAQVRNKAPE
jgi:hypothetical protein